MARTSHPSDLPALTEGQIVHYVLETGACRAAIIARVVRHRGADMVTEEGPQAVWFPSEMLNLMVILDEGDAQHVIGPTHDGRWLRAQAIRFDASRLSLRTWHLLEPHDVRIP